MVSESAGMDLIAARPLSPRIGCEVHIPRESVLSGQHAAEIRRLLVLHGVLRFPNANLDDQEQLAFARTLGEIVQDWYVSADKSVNSNQRLAEYQKSSLFWHLMVLESIFRISRPSSARGFSSAGQPGRPNSPTATPRTRTCPKPTRMPSIDFRCTTASRPRCAWRGRGRATMS